jgi:hypothetical protein
MPYFRDKNLEDDNEQGGGVQLSSAGMQAGPSGDPNQKAKSANSGSNFANIDNYLRNNNGQAFGQEVGSRVQGSINQARQGVDTAVGEVRNQIQQAPGAPALEQINQVVQGAGKNTTPDQAKQFQGWMNQSYQGPSGLSDNQAAHSRLQGGINKAKAEATAVGTEAGRFSLLDQYFGRPNYSFGQKSLDNLLVQGGGGLGNTRAYQDQAAQLGGYAKDQSEGLVRDAAQKKGEIEQGRINARTAIGLDEMGQVKGGALGGFQSDVDNRVKAAAQARDDGYNSILDDLADYRVSQDTLAATGLQGGELAYDLDFKNYLNKGADPTRAQVASKDDYARYLALTQLAGIDPTFLTPETQSQAGKYDPKSSFDIERFRADQGGAKASYDAALSNFFDVIRNRDYPGLHTTNPDAFFAGLDPNDPLRGEKNRRILAEYEDLQKRYGTRNKINAPIRGIPEGGTITPRPSQQAQLQQPGGAIVGDQDDRLAALLRGGF